VTVSIKRTFPVQSALALRRAEEEDARASSPAFGHERFFVKIRIKRYSSDAARDSPLKYDILYPERALLAIANGAKNPIITGL
jgi:hypothetical protein